MPRRSAVASLLDFAVIGSVVLPEQELPGVPGVLAELSGTWYDPDTQQLFAVMDQRDNPALLEMAVEIVPKVTLTVRRATILEQASVRQTLDLEGVSPAPDGQLFVASEGESGNPDRPSPGVFEYTRDGRYVRRLGLPAAYAGMRSNAGLEGLSTSPDGRFVFAAVEGSLRQDGPIATFSAGALTRILVFDLQSEAAPREYLYQTEAVPALPGGTKLTGDNGVAEILALGVDDLLVLERAYVEDTSGTRSANAVRLFRVRLDSASEVTGAWAAGDVPAVALRKTMALDLSTLAGALDPRLASLENFEGMSFGPRLPDGRRTLLLISDNNCNDTQVTALVVLAITERPAPTRSPGRL